jgi:hypothetical protein
MDWKKLTFYYFADTYINFNSLVTDLFKIYKTRIWMSAINPASFATPTLGLQAPSGIGPGAVGHGRNTGAATAERRTNAAQESQGNFPSGNAPSRSFQPSFGQQFNPAERSVANTGFPPSGLPYSAYGAFGGAPRTGTMPFVPGVMPMDAYPGGFPQTGEFPRPRFPDPHQTGSPPHDQGASNMSGQPEWVGAFQGLSLNSR